MASRSTAASRSTTKRDKDKGKESDDTSTIPGEFYQVSILLEEEAEPESGNFQECVLKFVKELYRHRLSIPEFTRFASEKPQEFVTWLASFEEGWSKREQHIRESVYQQLVTVECREQILANLSAPLAEREEALLQKTHELLQEQENLQCLRDAITAEKNFLQQIPGSELSQKLLQHEKELGLMHEELQITNQKATRLKKTLSYGQRATLQQPDLHNSTTLPIRQTHVQEPYHPSSAFTIDSHSLSIDWQDDQLEPL
ncbi:hypothetical protein KEM55_003934 [Ascosphaera atra]|nr:hypothetical protein KEM55_003934 [Ascosphaera atra]